MATKDIMRRHLTETGPRNPEYDWPSAAAAADRASEIADHATRQLGTGLTGFHHAVGWSPAAAGEADQHRHAADLHAHAGDLNSWAAELAPSSGDKQRHTTAQKYHDDKAQWHTEKWRSLGRSR